MHNRQSQPGHADVPRRSSDTTLEKLDDALSTLERRMGIGSTPGGQTSPPETQQSDFAAIRAKQEALARRGSALPERGGYVAYAPGAEDADVRSELAKMRETLNREVGTTIAQQFDSIREELRQLGGVGSAVSGVDLTDGFNRLTRELGVVASRVENSDGASLRAEIDDLKNHVAALAREDTLRDMADRWTVIEREIGSLPETLGSRNDLMAIADRISDINEAITGLPDSRVMAAMESQTRTLAQAIETLVSQNAAVSPDHLIAIDNRLDEINRAIVAISVAAAPPNSDPAPFERIEARLTSLAEQVDAMPSGGGFETVATRLDDLARLLDRDAQTAGGLPDDILKSLDARFEEIANRLDTHSTSAQESGERMFQSLDARMEELARRIDENEREGATVPTFDHMERRIEEIAQLLTAGDTFTPGVGGQYDGPALEQLETQIAALNERLADVPPAVDNSELADLAPRLMKISEQLTNGRDDMISAARDAAEEFVGKISPGASETDRQALSNLSSDLHGLEELARTADDRNVRTFEAIHDTLVKVADRIAGLETSLSGVPAMPVANVPAHGADPAANAPVGGIGHEAPANPATIDAPPVDFSEDRVSELASTIDEMRQPPRGTVAPAVAALTAARAFEGLDYDRDTPPDGPPERESTAKSGILKGLKGALSRSGSKTAAAEKPFSVDEPQVFGQSAADSDEPLEPGSGGPDLAAIMQRVRDERAGHPPAIDSGSPRDDSGKSDFIAAARRAARAAADEVAVHGAGDEAGGKKKPRFVRSRNIRRPLLLGVGAILLALMAIPLVRGLLIGDPSPPVVATQSGQDAAVTAAPVDGPPADSPETAAPETVRVIGNADGDDAAPERMETADMTEAAPPETGSAVLEPVAAETRPDAVDETVPASDGALTLADIPESVGPVALREAAAAGDPKALFLLGDRLTAAARTTPGGDMSTALRWYQMSADLGYAPAQYRIANLYEKGITVERDVAVAKTWYQLAAEQGNASAMHNLAVLFATEIDGRRDMASASRWFQRAAELGVTDSQVNLGILAARGEGVQPNLVESYKWLALAAEGGDKDAAVKRDEVAKVMRPDQLQTARGAVELWKKKPLDVASNEVDIPPAWRMDSGATAANPVAPDPMPTNSVVNEQMTKAVRNIQAILNNNGFDAGEPDGVMGTKTREAIIAFQHQHNMAPTGEVDRALVEKLLELNRS